jgi:hypothetical protein
MISLQHPETSPRELPFLKSFVPILTLFVIACGCSKQTPPAASSTTTPVSPSAALPPRLQEYFDQFCDYTGGLGIGFVPSHTYDFSFRQRLKQTQDPEFKRLFVLEHLHREIELALHYFEKGIKSVGKNITKPLTPTEWETTRQSILQRIDDLAAYSAFTNYAVGTPDELGRLSPEQLAVWNRGWIEELRERMQAATNAPGTTTKP